MKGYMWFKNIFVWFYIKNNARKSKQNPNQKSRKLVSPFSGSTIHWPEIGKIFWQLRDVDRVDTSIFIFCWRNSDLKWICYDFSKMTPPVGSFTGTVSFPASLFTDRRSEKYSVDSVSYIKRKRRSSNWNNAILS